MEKKRAVLILLGLGMIITSLSATGVLFASYISYTQELSEWGAKNRAYEAASRTTFNEQISEPPSEDETPLDNPISQNTQPPRTPERRRGGGGGGGGGSGGGSEPSGPGPTTPQCRDSIDNDGDTLIDYPFDAGCSSLDDDDESPFNTLPQCSDGNDNDGDHIKDYPFDAGCENAEDNDESPRATGCAETTCNVCAISDLANIQNNLAAHYVQTCDIDLTGIGWYPLGAASQDSTLFKGIFDGNGYSIRGLSIHPNAPLDEGIGLFAAIGSAAELRNIRLESVAIDLSTHNDVNNEQLLNAYIGALVGKIAPSPGGAPLITNLIANGVVRVPRLNTALHATGGIVGKMERGSMNAIETNIIVYSENDQVGGIVGQASTSLAPSLALSELSARGTVQGKNMVGGLLGVGEGIEISSASFEGEVHDILQDGVLIGGAIGNVIDDARLSNIAVRANVGGRREVGGIVGRIKGIFDKNILLSQGRFEGTVHAQEESAGGIAGHVQLFRLDAQATGDYVTFEHMYTNALVESPVNVGGIVGSTESLGEIGRPLHIKESLSKGSVTGNQAGGLVGHTNYPTLLEDVYSFASVTGNQAGGLVGQLLQNSILRRSYAAGTVVGSQQTGGLVGSQDGSAVIEESYWDTETTGQVTSAGGIGRTSAEMRDPQNYLTWDFSTIWFMLPDDYPRLLFEQNACGPVGCSPPTQPQWFTKQVRTYVTLHGLIFLVFCIGFLITLFMPLHPRIMSQETVVHANPEVVAYLREGRRRGFPLELLQRKLIEGGFTPQDVTDATCEM